MTDEGLVDRTVLPPVPASVPAARRFVAAVAHRWGFAGLPAETALVVSELVTNAVEHGSGDVDVVVRGKGDGLRLEVTTAATPERPERHDPPAMTPSGRGLKIVEALTASWGHAAHGDRRTVWALLAATRAAS